MLEKVFVDLKRINTKLDNNDKPHVFISGGEPFMHSKIDRVLSVISDYADDFEIRFLTNGTLLTTSLVDILKNMNIFAIQVSIDGNRNLHDLIRGTGNLSQVLNGIKVIKTRSDIPVYVSFTANSLNYNTFSEVAELCRDYNVDILWSDRYIPFKDNNLFSALNSTETLQYINILNKEKNNLKNYQVGLKILNNRGLQFIASSDYPYRCTAGQMSAAIDEHGDVFPCRRLPVIAGNIYKENFFDIYFSSDIFNLARRMSIPKECNNCKYSDFCMGGSRCQAYAVYNNLESKDPGCPLEVYEN